MSDDQFRHSSVIPDNAVLIQRGVWILLDMSCMFCSLLLERPSSRPLTSWLHVIDHCMLCSHVLFPNSMCILRTPVLYLYMLYVAL